MAMNKADRPHWSLQFLLNFTFLLSSFEAIDSTSRAFLPLCLKLFCLARDTGNGEATLDVTFCHKPAPTAESRRFVVRRFLTGPAFPIGYRCWSSFGRFSSFSDCSSSVSTISTQILVSFVIEVVDPFSWRTAVDFDGDSGGTIFADSSVSFFTPFSITRTFSSSSALSSHSSSSSSSTKCLCFSRISSTLSKSPLSTALQQKIKI